MENLSEIAYQKHGKIVVSEKVCLHYATKLLQVLVIYNGREYLVLLKARFENLRLKYGIGPNDIYRTGGSNLLQAQIKKFLI